MIKIILIHNHEIWVICAGCGNEFDIRVNSTCGDCGETHEWGKR